jgi:hypothetical protein
LNILGVKRADIARVFVVVDDLIPTERSQRLVSNNICEEKLDFGTTKYLRHHTFLWYDRAATAKAERVSKSAERMTEAEAVAEMRSIVD